MEYSYSKMNLKKGDIVEVNLEKQANVILLDHINYVIFKIKLISNYYKIIWVPQNEFYSL